MATIASQITSLTIVYSTVHSGADQRKYQSSASLPIVRGIHRRTDNCGASVEESRDSIHDNAENTKENGELVAKGTQN